MSSKTNFITRKSVNRIVEEYDYANYVFVRKTKKEIEQDSKKLLRHNSIKDLAKMLCGYNKFIRHALVFFKNEKFGMWDITYINGMACMYRKFKQLGERKYYVPRHKGELYKKGE